MGKQEIFWAFLLYTQTTTTIHIFATDDVGMTGNINRVDPIPLVNIFNNANCL